MHLAASMELSDFQRYGFSRFESIFPELCLSTFLIKYHLQVEIYDPKTKVWSQGRAMQCCRSAVGVAALDDKVYENALFTQQVNQTTTKSMAKCTFHWMSVRISRNDNSPFPFCLTRN